MKRFDPTERIGVNATERIITKNLGWIFREQSIADVGIDGIIEQVQNGEPTGKFIAIQIKSGLGNFYKTEKGLTYYVSNVHYNYWLNLNIPIILVAHLPNEDETYWQAITTENLKKSKKRWKIEIPLKQKLNEKSESRLVQILSLKNEKKFDVFRGRVDSNDIDEINEDIKSITDATICINNISAFLNSQTTETNRLTEKLNHFIEKKSPDLNAELINTYKALGKSMNLTARRSETEIELFSQLYSIGISGFEKLIIGMQFLNFRLEDFVDDVNFIEQVPNQIDYALNTFINLRDTVSSMPNNHSTLKEAKKQYIEVLDLIINELGDAVEMTKNIFAKII
ncbi:DUF4365 domain-containing protein [Flavobacterium ginsenosidimutans]|uniref:DUF4365 domain-containing protein n=1 Tax=Flavobacterium ginsenosidimutans TaxID=687844 RepID=A0ABZ2Q4G2_9FLAO|nr:DUF4365 domain-containing protein [Flavobacterium ginsenosidimutans]KAF2327830.1 DUF4365 domain-containing protein [Flavobacterium ginsenosidimutans]